MTDRYLNSHYFVMRNLKGDWGIISPNCCFYRVVNVRNWYLFFLGFGLFSRLFSPIYVLSSGYYYMNMLFSVRMFILSNFYTRSVLKFVLTCVSFPITLPLYSSILPDENQLLLALYFRHLHRSWWVLTNFLMIIIYLIQYVC